MTLDVAIVGASTAGLYAAEQLASAGRRVAIFEQQPHLAPARRTLIITPELRRFLDFSPESSVLHYTKIMSVHTDNCTVDIELQDPDLIIERGLFTQQLAERATKAGVEIHYGHRFQGISPHPEGATLTFRVPGATSIQILAKAIIGADGAFTDVAPAVGLKRPPTVPILQAEVSLPEGWDPALTRVWFDTRDTRFFYWLIPESQDRAVVGLVGDDGAQTRTCLRAFLEHHNLQPLAYQGAQIAMYHPRIRTSTRVGSAIVFLVGDAAGQVKVTTVGGTVSGIWGANAAVQALLSGRSYEYHLRGLNRELNLHWLIRTLMEGLDNPGYDNLVKMITPRIQQFLSERNRDQMVGGFWQLPLMQPRLLTMSLDLLWKTRKHFRTSPSLPAQSQDEIS